MRLGPIKNMRIIGENMQNYAENTRKMSGPFSVRSRNFLAEIFLETRGAKVKKEGNRGKTVGIIQHEFLIQSFLL